MRRLSRLPLLLLAGLLVSTGSGAKETESWTRWGGPGQDFRTRGAEIAESWPAGGPATLWERSLGDGYSTVLYDDGRLYTMYRPGDREAVIALDAATGKTVWEYRYEHDPDPDHVTQFGSGPRATPLIVGDRIFSIGVAGRLLALRKTDGEPLWSHDLWGEELAGNRQPHGYSSSPVAYGEMVIALVGGGTAGIVAFAQKDGEIVWRSEGFPNGYATPRVFRIDGRDQLVASMDSDVVGLDPATGATLWRHEVEDAFGHGISPLVLHDEKILFVSSVRGGSMALELTKGEDGETRVERLWETRKVRFFHVTNVADGGWVYGSSGSGSPAFLAAIDVRTGEVAWRERGFSKANVVAVDDRLLVLDEDGLLGLARATPEGLEVLSTVPLLDRVAWSAPTVVGSRMFVRDTERILAVDLASGASEATAAARAASPSRESSVVDAPPLPDLPDDASKALRILHRVDAAARAVDAVRYRASVRATGSASASTQAAEGTVVAEGWTGTGPARSRTELEIAGEGDAEAQRLVGGGDGEVYYLVDSVERKAWVDIDPAVTGSRGRTINGFGMIEFLHPTPFSDEVGAEAEWIGVETIGGIECDRVEVDYGGAGRSTWYFSREDHLPRKRIRHVADRDGDEGTLEITVTSLEVDPDLGDEAFRFELPEGYEKVEDFAP